MSETMVMTTGKTAEQLDRMAVQQERMERGDCPNCGTPMLQRDCSSRVCAGCGFEHHGSFGEVPS